MGLFRKTDAELIERAQAATNAANQHAHTTGSPSPRLERRATAADQRVADRRWNTRVQRETEQG